jgi:FkbM family methyltransferase
VAVAPIRTRAKSAARRVLGAAGVEMRRRGGVRREPEEVLSHVARLGFEPATVVDVGVAYGTPELYEAFPRARLLMVEPLAEYEHALGEIARSRPGAEYVLAAAGAEPGRTVMNVHRAPALSSTLGHWRGQPRDGNEREVPVVRVDDLRDERGLPGPYVVKVDVEGGELGVLDGARHVLEETELVLLEVQLFEFLPGAPQLHDVVAYMKNRGFVVYDMFGGHLRPLDGALAMVNVAFVREDGRFRGSHEFATEEQAERMYRSWGY